MQRSHEILISKYERAYWDAVERGEFSRARVLAIKCAGLFRELASLNLEFSDYYLEMAKQWEKRAGELENGHRYSQRKSVNLPNVVQTSNVTWDDVGGLWEAKKYYRGL